MNTVHCDSCKKEMREGNIGQAKYICTNLTCWKSDPHWDEPKVEEVSSKEQKLSLSPFAFTGVWLLTAISVVILMGTVLALLISMAKIQSTSDLQNIVMPFVFKVAAMLGIIYLLTITLISIDKHFQNKEQS